MKKKILSLFQISFLGLFLLVTHKVHLFGECMQNSMGNIRKNESVKYKNVYFVILAGGSGTRLWPLSRQNKPKQFLAVGKSKTLLDQAIDRICNLVPKENIWISTTERHKKNIVRYVGDRIGNIVVEPGMRNTAPAILLACLEIQKVNPEACVIFLPSDPFIEDQEKFVQYMHQAIQFMENNNKITLFGIKPTYPATGYGYIEFDTANGYGDNNNNNKSAPYPVLQFHEKPKLSVAKEYIKKDNMVWNICTFCGKCHVFVKEFEKYAPDILQGVRDYVNGVGDYNEVRKDSIDYAIMEKSKNTCVIPADFPWCDVGNIEVFLTIQKQHMQLKENTVSVDSKNNLVNVKDKLVALVGVDNLCVVEADGILLVTRRDKAEQVKQIVQKLKEDSNNSEYL
ncbi:mannose-1-phosphate guanylyltransferase [Candidatus Dependentiae bacterium]